MGEGKKKRKMPKVTAARIMYIAAIQIVLTTIGFILQTISMFQPLKLVGNKNIPMAEDKCSFHK